MIFALRCAKKILGCLGNGPQVTRMEGDRPVRTRNNSGGLGGWQWDQRVLVRISKNCFIPRLPHFHLETLRSTLEQRWILREITLELSVFLCKQQQL